MSAHYLTRTTTGSAITSTAHGATSGRVRNTASAPSSAALSAIAESESRHASPPRSTPVTSPACYRTAPAHHTAVLLGWHCMTAHVSPVSYSGPRVRLDSSRPVTCSPAHTCTACFTPPHSSSLLPSARVLAPRPQPRASASAPVERIIRSHDGMPGQARQGLGTPTSPAQTTPARRSPPPGGVSCAHCPAQNRRNDTHNQTPVSHTLTQAAMHSCFAGASYLKRGAAAHKSAHLRAWHALQDRLQG